MTDPGADDRETHPELAAWLAERSAGFTEWARATGEEERWDFGPDSLDALEDLVRRTFAGEDEVTAAKSGSFVQGAVWYIGEVVRRTQGAVWRYEPFAPGGGTPPALFASGKAAVTDTPQVVRPYGEEQGSLYPMGALNELYWDEDELDNPMEAHLRDVLDSFA
ncbi:hypothetical protein ACFOZ0_32030 [Streptomyces yaanensis]|uniref:Uncharacterized protein n=1 Tax=Streptomyces yaanensis TaxID=1142239 RepID=A0ABV7SLE1_9ACTN|nr:hypothetical protein [Streptomyces sp. CGMCC 4.7035]WNC02088.1 hypothetical protein Q2K21_30745 [Streptomyces sp. CGMCC 4.7035]